MMRNVASQLFEDEIRALGRLDADKETPPSTTTVAPTT